MSSLDCMKQLTFFFIFDAEMLSWIGRTDASIKIADHQLLLLKSHIYKQCCWFHNILEILSNFIEIVNMYGIKNNMTWYLYFRLCIYGSKGELLKFHIRSALL